MRISDWSSDVCSSDLGGALRLKVGVAASEVENRVAGDRPCATKRGSRQEDRLIDLVALVEGGRLERLTPSPLYRDRRDRPLDQAELGCRHICEALVPFVADTGGELEEGSESGTHRPAEDRQTKIDLGQS